MRFAPQTLGAPARAPMKRAATIALGLLLLSGPLAAEITPRAGPHDARVRDAIYVQGQVYNLVLMLERVTTVELPRGEEIVSVVAGDTQSFDFDAVPGGQAFVIKPKRSGARTNITVFTNRRTYYFVASASRNTAFYSVRFTVPADQTRERGARVPAHRVINTRYGGNDMTAITPIEVWDDGTFTYFRFETTRELPTIFAISDGMERIANSTLQRDGTVRVSGTSPYWVLRLGEIETAIANLGEAR
ncbi:TrbG/VirB9 family P-type conjugative transfer protein [Roseibaca calidilacus]|jgi:type IV secretion system protein VirB9|uniref:Type IV secretion system protein VirB9 n=1 Tax=Roseibaca calidilacus TaxID=1666912 RepID=A0ABM9VQM8_9RHOB|nr:TrbG/VirB9 family P-type conjugative transfer protein [Roseibaca calidilacus]CUX79975.1 type IV secretion system protein VirB9 [Roseibaca calidilacus]